MRKINAETFSSGVRRNLLWKEAMRMGSSFLKWDVWIESNYTFDHRIFEECLVFLPLLRFCKDSAFARSQLLSSHSVPYSSLWF